MNMNGYVRRTEAKKSAIIEAARELFVQRGITAVGVSEIAAKAGVSQVSIYNYFGDKRNLAKQVVSSNLSETIRAYDEILEQDISFAEKLQMILTRKQDLIEETGRARFSAVAQQDQMLQQVLKELATAHAVTIYSKFIEQGKQAGAIADSIPSEAILSFLLSSLTILQQPEYLSSSNEHKLGMLHLFLYGVLGKTAQALPQDVGQGPKSQADLL